MFSADFPDNQEKTSLPALAAWVREIAELAKPDAVVWCDGSAEEWDRLTALLVENGTFRRLNPSLRLPLPNRPSPEQCILISPRSRDLS